MLQQQKWFLVTAVVFALLASPAVFGFNANTDDSLVGWWPLNDGSGTTAVDASGNGNNGTLNGNPEWVTGKFKGALSFDGSGDYIDCGNGPTLDIRDQITMTYWIKTSGFTTDWSAIISKGDGAWRMSRSATTGNALHMGFGGTTTSGNTYLDGTIPVTDDEWHFGSGVYDGTEVRIYVDGVLDVSQAATGQLASATYNVLIGENAQQTGRYLNATLDDVRVYNRGLTLDELNEVMTGGSDPALATDPSPVDTEEDVALDSVLAWSPGVYAVSHDVYMGTNFDDVNDASRSNPGDVLVSQGQSDTTYTPAGLELDGTYYWRVDEVNASPSTIFKGTVWSFQAEPTYFKAVPVNVTASSNAGEGYDPNNTINESGLTNDLHATDSGTNPGSTGNMWTTAEGDVAGAWIQYEFDGPKQIGSMLVWNANPAYESILGVGIKEATIETSLDGQTWTDLAGTLTFNRASGQGGYAANTTIDFAGRMATYVRINVISHWADFTTTVGLSEVRFMVVPVAARRPEPASGNTLKSLMDQLVWRAGRGAEQHQLYIDMNEALVAASDPSALVGTLTERHYDLSNTNLLYAEKYYWKVVELSGDNAVDGPVWDFNTPPYLVVDNMDSYNDNEGTRIFDSWADGYGPNDNGSVVGYGTAPFSETSIIFGGTQSMPYTYENTGGVTQASADLDLGDQNWSRGGAQTLVLYFLGERGNDNATLYISVDGHRVNSASPLNLGLWTQMNVDLGSLGINLSNVQTLTIGVNGAGTGLLYIDEIRVYREAPPIVVPTDPGSNGLVLHYEMENSVADTSGSGLNGTAQGSPVYVDSLSGLGQALEFDGVEDYVEVPIGNKITGWSDSTFSIWVNINPDNTTSNWMRAFDFGSADTTNLFLCPRTGTNGAVRTAIRVPSKNNGNEVGVTSSATLSDGWHHVACVFDNDANTLTLYVDGWSAGSVETDIRPMDLGVTTNNWLGQSQYDADSLYDGLLDEFRIYNRALSAGEVRYLAGDH